MTSRHRHAVLLLLLVCWNMFFFQTDKAPLTDTFIRPDGKTVSIQRAPSLISRLDGAAERALLSFPLYLLAVLGVRLFTQDADRSRRRPMLSLIAPGIAVVVGFILLGNVGFLGFFAALWVAALLYYAQEREHALLLLRGFLADAFNVAKNTPYWIALWATALFGLSASFSLAVLEKSSLFGFLGVAFTFPLALFMANFFAPRDSRLSPDRAFRAFLANLLLLTFAVLHAAGPLIFCLDTATDPLSLPKPLLIFCFVVWACLFSQYELDSWLRTKLESIHPDSPDEGDPQEPPAQVQPSVRRVRRPPPGPPPRI